MKNTIDLTAPARRIGLMLLVVASAMGLPHVSKTAQAAMPGLVSQDRAVASAPAAKPSLTVQRLGELVAQADPWTLGVLKTMVGGFHLQIRQDDSQGLVIGVEFDKAIDGRVAESVGTSIAEMAVKELVETGVNPHLQKRIVQTSVYTLDVPASVTGEKQYMGFGHAVYSPQTDNIEWRHASSHR